MLPSEKPYLKTGVFQLAKNRIAWLLILMISSMITGGILAKYEAAFAVIPLLVTFIPMLTDTGGNAGSQSSTMIIRGMAVGEIEPGDLFKVLWKELRVGVNYRRSHSGLRQLRSPRNSLSGQRNAVSDRCTEPDGNRRYCQDHRMRAPDCGKSVPYGSGHHGGSADYDDCGCGEFDYLFPAGVFAAGLIGHGAGPWRTAVRIASVKFGYQ